MQITGFIPMRQTMAAPPPKNQPAPTEAYGDSVQLDSSLPDISGMARHSRGALAVTDAKAESEKARLGVVDGNTGQFEALTTDWSKTGRARDLEAITPAAQDGNYLAVEGSAWNGAPAHMFELKVGENGATSEKKWDLPPLSQEVEGMVQKPLDDGRSLVILGGRGGEKGEPGRLFWGVLDNNTNELTFSDAGKEGIEVVAPRLSQPGQRDISDLELRNDGTLWASAAVDNGDQGPFEAKVYQVGSLTGREDIPVLLSGSSNSSSSIYSKVEGFASWGGGLLTGSDNEGLGGEVGFLLAR